MYDGIEELVELEKYIKTRKSRLWSWWEHLDITTEEYNERIKHLDSLVKV